MFAPFFDSIPGSAFTSTLEVTERNFLLAEINLHLLLWSECYEVPELLLWSKKFNAIERNKDKHFIYFRCSVTLLEGYLDFQEFIKQIFTRYTIHLGNETSNFGTSPHKHPIKADHLLYFYIQTFTFPHFSPENIDFAAVMVSIIIKKLFPRMHVHVYLKMWSKFWLIHASLWKDE